jgi:hypothetical protein
MQIATNALLSLAEKVLGICVPDKRATGASFSTNAHVRSERFKMISGEAKASYRRTKIVRSVAGSGQLRLCARSLSPT